MDAMGYRGSVALVGTTLCVVSACGGSGAPSIDAETTAGETATGVASTSSSGSGSSTESTSTSTGPEPDTTTASDTEGDDPLAVCHDLPAAAIAMWEAGDDVESTAESTPERIAAAGARTWSLALELLRVTDAVEHPSLASSPTAMALALGMTHLRFPGAQCGDSIHAAIGWEEDGDPLHQTLGASVTVLESRALPSDGQGADPVVVGLQPSTWDIGEGSPPTVSETQLLFGGEANTVSNSGEGALAAINEVMNCVIEQRSHGLLVDFLPASLPAPDTTSFDLTLAYLGAPWASAFEGDAPVVFTRDDGGNVELPGMYAAVSEATYYTDASMTAVDIPLRGGALVMQIVLPQPELYPNLETFVESVTPGDLELARTSGAQGTIEVTMPMFRIDSATIDYYELLGLDCELFTMRKVLHGAGVVVDEKGIEAAAGTGDEDWATGTGSSGTIASVVVDHPFLFFVYDRETSNVLYSGRYAG